MRRRTNVQICRYLDSAPDDPEGILLFGTLNLMLTNVLLQSQTTADIAVLTFYMHCHCDIGHYVVPPDICASVDSVNPGVSSFVLSRGVAGNFIWGRGV